MKHCIRNYDVCKELAMADNITITKNESPYSTAFYVDYHIKNSKYSGYCQINIRNCQL